MALIDLAMDIYERKARLYPALLLIAPAIATSFAVVSAKLGALQSLGAALVGCGGAFLLTQIARDLGKKKEHKLFARWGGQPSVAIFRHRDTQLGSVTKARYHKILQELVSEPTAPSAEDESVDPSAADEVYRAWSDYIRTHTRDTKEFAVLFTENVNYGYRRNVWGLRAIGITIAAVCALICVMRLVYFYQTSQAVDETFAGAGLLSLSLLFLWLFHFTSDWVRVTAEAYARRLAECVEILGAKGKSTK